MSNAKQKELAEKLGVSEVTLSRASNGITSLPLLEKIANSLEVEISELFSPLKTKEGTIFCPNCGAELEIKVKEISKDK